MRHRIFLLALAPGFLGLVGCGSSGKDSAQSPLVEDSVEEVLTLVLPSIPSTISEPEDKAGFIAIHFWDNLDFSDEEKVSDIRFMEQNFVDYLSIFPAVMATDRQAAFDVLMSRSAVSPSARAMIVSFGEKYLNHPDSPMKNSEYYTDFRNSVRRQAR